MVDYKSIVLHIREWNSLGIPYGRKDLLELKRYYSKKFGYNNTNHEKDFCLFWAYQPIGLWGK